MMNQIEITLKTIYYRDLLNRHIWGETRLISSMFWSMVVEQNMKTTHKKLR